MWGCGKAFTKLYTLLSTSLFILKRNHSSVKNVPQDFPVLQKKKHSEENTYRCREYGKAFANHYVFSRHKTVHTGEKSTNVIKCLHFLSPYLASNNSFWIDVPHVCGMWYSPYWWLSTSDCIEQGGHVQVKNGECFIAQSTLFTIGNVHSAVRLPEHEGGERCLVFPCTSNNTTIFTLNITVINWRLWWRFQLSFSHGSPSVIYTWEKPYSYAEKDQG